MRRINEFEFPPFREMQLGEWQRGNSRCGCFLFNLNKIRSRGLRLTDKAVMKAGNLSEKDFSSLCLFSAKNTVANRRRAYNAMVDAVRAAGWTVS